MNDIEDLKIHLRWLNGRWLQYNKMFREHIIYLNGLIPDEEREKVGIKPYLIYQEV